MNPPPLLVSFEDRDTFFRALTVSHVMLYGAELDRLINAGLPPVSDRRSLAVLFGYSSQFIEHLVKHPETQYRQFTIKKGKKTRVINAPKVGLKLIQKWVGHHLSLSVKLPECAFGFIPGKSAPKAASCHVKAQWVYSTDIQDFFPSTSTAQVQAALSDLGYSQSAAYIIGRLCCLNNGLAQGSPASPTLSNLVFKPFDERLEELAQLHDLRFTRYADDIVFSGTGNIPEDLVEQVHRIIESGGWKISYQKDKIAELPHRLKVHGLLVHRESIRLTKGYRNRLRAFKHLTETNRVRDEDKSRISGHMSYAKSISRLAAGDDNSNPSLPL